MIMDKEKRWKAAFIILLLSVISIVIISVLAFFYYFPSVTQTDEINQHRPIKDGAEFTLTTNKEELNLLIHRYLQRKAPTHKRMDYEVYLEESIMLEGIVSVWDRNISFTMSFEPKVLENGDLLLKQKEFQVGRLHVPVDRLLQLIRNTYTFPEWVTIQPDRHSIYLALSEVNPNSEFRIRAKTFDLDKDLIEFRVNYQP
jgi:uncharacterized protein YpmS